LVVTTRDRSPGHIVEGGLDKFFITGSPVGIEEQTFSTMQMSAYPNPFTNDITIKYDLVNSISSKALIELFDVTGRVVEQLSVNQNKGVILLSPKINAGIYYVRISDGTELSKPLKVVKVK